MSVYKLNLFAIIFIPSDFSLSLLIPFHVLLSKGKGGSRTKKAPSTKKKKSIKWASEERRSTDGGWRGTYRWAWPHSPLIGRGDKGAGSQTGKGPPVSGFAVVNNGEWSGYGVSQWLAVSAGLGGWSASPAAVASGDDGAAHGAGPAPDRMFAPDDPSQAGQQRYTPRAAPHDPREWPQEARWAWRVWGYTV